MARKRTLEEKQRIFLAAMGFSLFLIVCLISTKEGIFLATIMGIIGSVEILFLDAMNFAGPSFFWFKESERIDEE